MSEPGEGRVPPATPRARSNAVAGWRPSRAAGAALLTGLLVTAVLVVTCSQLYDHNESRLLSLKGRELSSLLSAAVSTIQTPLAAAAELADGTGGSPQKFRAFMAPYVGTGRQFASASLWPLGSAHPRPLAVVGATPLLAALPEQARHFFSQAARGSRLNVTGFLGSHTPGLGYEYATPGDKHGFAAYAESALPKDRRSQVASSSAFSDLNYALYLGDTRRFRALLVTSLSHFPISGRQSTDVVPFGDAEFRLVVTPKGSLGGGFFKNLQWIVALVGVALTLAATLLSDRLAQRRMHAEGLARDLEQVATTNREMYAEQRGIAETLQHALLPESLPQIRGLEVSARYVPAATGIDIGGDWYDVVAGEQGVLVMIGDVSGHGLRAASTMASLRHAALAFASEDHNPGRVLARLSDFVNSGPHDYFATMLCVLIDVERRSLTLASAGHIAPLLLDGEDGRFLGLDVNVPIGVRRTAPYHEASVSVPPDSTLIAFTDGLIERRGEILDTGLSRLRAAAAGQRLGLEELLARIADDLASDSHHDDTAIVGIRWPR